MSCLLRSPGSSLSCFWEAGLLSPAPLTVLLSGGGCRDESEQKASAFLLSTAHLFPCAQEVMCFNAKLKILEHRQQRIAEVRAKYEWLMKELEATKQYLMLDPNKWLRECKGHRHTPMLASTVGSSNTV